MSSTDGLTSVKPLDFVNEVTVNRENRLKLRIHKHRMPLLRWGYATKKSFLQYIELEGPGFRSLSI